MSRCRWRDRYIIVDNDSKGRAMLVAELEDLLLTTSLSRLTGDSGSRQSRKLTAT